MSNKRRAFVKKPSFKKLKTQNLKYLDVLIYVTIKSFDNPVKGCFPAFETIAKRSGLCRTFVNESIKRLEKAEYLSVYREKKLESKNKSYPNQYSFRDEDPFNPVPYDIFSANDLTSNEKSILLLLRQFSVTDFEIYGDVKHFSKELELSYQTVKKQYDSLIRKGYLNPRDKCFIEMEKIDWSFPEHFPNNKKTVTEIKPYNEADFMITL